MAHSIVTFRGRRFDVHDDTLELLSYVLESVWKQEPDKHSKAFAQNMTNLLSDWEDQRNWAFGAGCADLHLDHHLNDDPSSQGFLRIAKHALKVIQSWPDPVSLAVRLRYEPPSTKDVEKDIPRKYYVRACECLIAILEGSDHPDAMYEVSRLRRR